MPDPDKRIAEIRERADAATPGPWHYRPGRSPIWEGTWTIVSPTSDLESGNRPTTPPVAVGLSEADARLVVGYRDDVPWLLAQLAEARGRVGELERDLAYERRMRSQDYREGVRLRVEANRGRDEARAEKASVGPGAREIAAHLRAEYPHNRHAIEWADYVERWPTWRSVKVPGVTRYAPTFPALRCDICGFPLAGDGSCSQYAHDKPPAPPSPKPPPPDVAGEPAGREEAIGALRELVGALPKCISPKCGDPATRIGLMGVDLCDDHAGHYPSCEYADPLRRALALLGGR